MVLAASPVQASDVDTRIQALERELAQLKQNQESALAAEMMVPTADEAAAAAKATAGGGGTRGESGCQGGDGPPMRRPSRMLPAQA